MQTNTHTYKQKQTTQIGGEKIRSLPQGGGGEVSLRVSYPKTYGLRAMVGLERPRRGWEELEMKRTGKGGREGQKEWSQR